MSARLLFGQRGSEFGLWVSKPGYDVRNALPGEFLITPSSTVFQIVASGNTLLTSAAIPAFGTVSATAPLPSDFAPYSRLQMFCFTYYIHKTTGQIYYDEFWTDYTRSIFGAHGGTVYLTFQSLIDGVYDLGQLWIRWVVFREQY